MVLVVEDGTGLANAESYDSVAGIIATLTKYGEETVFAAVTPSAAQEAIARKATRRLDTEERFRGEKKSGTQALEWPRVGAYDDDGWPYEGVPARLKEALAQLCAAGAVDLQPNQSSGDAALKSKSIQVGKVSVSKTWVAGSTTETFYRKAESLLGELVESSGELVRA